MLARESLSDQLADAIARQIIQNELKSGEPVIETKISKEWDVSRSPVKIALLILERKKLVEKPVKGSYRVTELSSEFVDQFYDTTNVLYGYAFSRAAERIRNGDLKNISSILEIIEDSLVNNDFNNYIEGIQAYLHKALQISQNEFIENVLIDLTSSIERLYLAAIKVTPLFLEKAHLYFREIHIHLSAGNAQKASVSYVNFSNTFRQVLIEHLKIEKIMK